MLLLVFFGASFAQTSTVDSGEPEYITTEILRLESIRITAHEDFLQGLDALEKERQKMSAYQMCHFKFLKAYKLAFEGQTEAAITAIEDLIPLCEDLRARIRLDALLSNVSAVSGDYGKASAYIDNTIQNVEQTADSRTKAIAYTAASMVYNLLDQKELSIKYSELLNELEPSQENECRLLYSKNLFHLDGAEIGQIPAVNFYDNACTQSGNELFAQSILLDSIKRRLAFGELNADSIADLRALIQKIKTDISTGPYKNIQAQFAAIEAKFALLQGDIETANQNGLAAIDLNEGLGNTEQLIMALEVLEKVAIAQKKYQLAYEYLDRKNQVELGLYDQSQAKQMAFMTVKHSNLAKVFEIEQLNKQKELLELEKLLAKQEGNNQRLIILLILVILTFMLLLLFRIKKRHDYFRTVSEIDHLTKVLTRKAFEEQLTLVLNQNRDKGQAVSVAIMDLDFFKQVNDNHGHLIGDWVLKNVIYSCKELIEEGMFIGRLGGEEFGLVMHKANIKTMHNKIESMRMAIEELDTSDSGVSIPITASFGITNTDESGYQLDLLLTHADLALFKAKNNGRNQSVVFKQSMS